MDKHYRFPGTKSFTSDESSIFFGRDDDIANICTSVVVNPTTLLFGKSGTGKSSLIQAGMLPALMARNPDEENQQEPYLAINVMPKPHDGNDTLYNKILSIIKKTTGPDNNFLQLPESPQLLSLWYILKQFQYRQFQEKKRQVLLLIFDQAEELFTYPDSQIYQLVQELHPVIAQFVPESFQKSINLQTLPLPADTTRILYTPLPVKFVFSIRSDKLHLITRLKRASPHILQNSYELLPLRKKEAFESMEGPSQHEGKFFLSEIFKIADETKEYIFQELSAQSHDPESNFEEARIEPFSLQIICSYIEQKLLQNEDDNIIEKHELDKPGTIINGYYLGCINSLQLNNKPLTEIEKNDVRVLLEERMLSNNRRIPIHKDIIMQYKDCKVSIETLKMLVDARILKKDYDAYGESIYEITHDYLIRPIQEAMEQRLGKTTDDKSMETINQLIKEIREMEFAKSTGDSRVKLSSGIKPGTQDINVGKTNIATYINEDPKLFELYKKLGDAYIVIRDYNKAIESFNKVIDSSAAHTSNAIVIEIYRARANAYYYLGNYEHSSNDLKKILDQNPEDYTAIIYLVENYDKENKLEEALKYFNTQLKITPQNTGLYTEIGNKYFARKDYEKARQCYQKTLVNNPRADYAIRNIGLIEETLGNTEGALKYYKQSLEFNPDSAAIYNDIGNQYYAMKDFKEAKENYHKAIKKDGGFHFAYYNIGLIEQSQNNIETAIEFYNKAVSAKPDYEDAYINMARLHYDRKEFDKAKAAYARLIALNPLNQNNYYDMGLIEESLENHRAALDSYYKAIELKPDDADVYKRIGKIKQEQGQTEEAIQAYEKAIALKPDSIEIINDLGICYYAIENWKRSEECFIMAKDADPGNYIYYYNIGTVKSKLDLYQEAEKLYSKSLELNPKYPDALYNYGELLEKMNKPAEAVIKYKKYLELSPEDNEVKERIAALEKTQSPAS